MNSESPGPHFDRGAVAKAVRALATSAGGVDVDRGGTKRDRIEMVSVASEALDGARESLDEAVRLARADCASWGDIGQVLGISRQAAFQRFGV